MADAIYVLMRWLHISSAVTLVGGMIFGRWVMTRAAGALAPDARETFLDRAAAIYQPLAFAAMGGLLVSGMYNILTIPGHRPRRPRMMAGAAISGLAIIAIAAYLRHIF